MGSDFILTAAILKQRTRLVLLGVIFKSDINIIFMQSFQLNFIFFRQPL